MSGTTNILRMDCAGKLTRAPEEEAFGAAPAKSNAAVNAAKPDPENPPLTKTRLCRMRRVPQVKVLRRALGLTQEEFSERFRIPLGTLRDWEQGCSQPDLPTRAYLKVIARDLDAVMRALQTA